MEDGEERGGEENRAEIHCLLRKNTPLSLQFEVDCSSVSSQQQQIYPLVTNNLSTN